MNIRERLMEEMGKCNSLKLFKNRVRKCNEILPDVVLDNVLSYVGCDCKKCDRTRRVMEIESRRNQNLRKDWENVDIEEIYGSERYNAYQEDCVKLWFYYFQELNHFPRKSTVYKRFKSFDESDLFNCLMFYESVHLKNLKIYENCRLDHTHKFRDFMLWMVCHRGCQFYPQIFDGEFQREVMTRVFGL